MILQPKPMRWSNALQLIIIINYIEKKTAYILSQYKPMLKNSKNQKW